jgi:putative N6-adenine-specific DNA methylase
LEIPEDRRQNGLIVLNPPYGLRLGSKSHIPELIADIGQKLKKDFKGWRLALIIPEARMMARIPFPVTPRPLFHGGLTVTLLTGRIH